MIQPNLPMRDYLANPAYGSSDLRAFRLGPPAMVPWRREHREETSSTIIGSAAACAILDPSTWADHYWVKPEGLEFRTKENKELRDGLLAKGLTILSQDDKAQIDQIVDAFHGKEELTRSLEECVHPEASIFWRCKHSGLQRKGRPDWFDDRYVYDLKISVIAQRGLHGIFKAAQDQGWLEQLAHNRAGLQACGYTNVKAGRLVVIHPKPPQLLRCWMLEVSEHDLDIFELQNETAAAGIAACEEKGYFPGTPATWIPFEVVGIVNEMTDNDLEDAEEAEDNPLI